MTAAALPDIETLIPHRAPMRLIDRVIEVEDGAIATQASVPTIGPFVAADANPPGYIVIEMMAQTVGAWNGWHHLQQERAPQIGYLLGTRRFRCDRATLIPGTRMRIEARLVFSDGEMACFACAAREADSPPFAEATLNLFCPATPSKAPP